jgi:hypothetical protein
MRSCYGVHGKLDMKSDKFGTGKSQQVIQSLNSLKELNCCFSTKKSGEDSKSSAQAGIKYFYGVGIRTSAED